MALLQVGLVLLGALHCSATVTAINATVIFGELRVSGGSSSHIGNLSSAINQAISTIFAPLEPASPSLHAIINSTLDSGALSYLTLTGNYTVDEPLLIPRQFVLVLEGVVLTAGSNLTKASAGLISINGSAFSAIVSPGGPSRALLLCPPGGPSPIGVNALNAPHFLLDGVSVDGCGHNNGDTGVHFSGQESAGGSILNCVVRNCARAIWTEATTHITILNNECYNNSAHTIDFDAFTANSLAFGNNVHDNVQEGVFIEQAASYIFVSGNTLGPNNLVGVAVYNNAISTTTTNHVIVGNTIIGNRNAGVGVGSTAPRSGAPTLSVTVAGNVLSDNGAVQSQGVHSNGGQRGTLYVGNKNPDGVSLYTQSLGGNVTIFDPLDRERALGY